MKNTLLIILVLFTISFATKITLYTEERIHGTYTNSEFIPSNTIKEDVSKWEIDTNAECFIHNTNTGSVLQSTYWITPQTVEDTEDGFRCIATSDAGNTRTFLFLKTVIIVILETVDENTQKCVLFPVKNITRDE